MLKRLQHDGFGKEIRELFGSTKVEDKRTLGIIVSELQAFDEARQGGQKHPNEERLSGDDLRDFQYLKLYKGGESIRLYFTTIGNHVWMLLLDKAKRRTALTDSVKERLSTRLREVRRLDEEMLREEAIKQGGR